MTIWSAVINIIRKSQPYGIIFPNIVDFSFLGLPKLRLHCSRLTWDHVPLISKSLGIIMLGVYLYVLVFIYFSAIFCILYLFYLSVGL